MLNNERITDYLKAVESNSPIPGGGSVAALTGAFGVSLALMYQNLSFEKKAYQRQEDSVKATFEQAFQEFKTYQSQLLTCAEQDSEAYQLVITAYQLPKNNAEEEVTRKQAISEATIRAIEVPLMTMKVTVESLKALDKIVGLGNNNAISDAGVAALLLEAATKSAYLNILINCQSLNNERSEKLLSEAKQYCADAEELKKKIMAVVDSLIK